MAGQIPEGSKGCRNIRIRKQKRKDQMHFRLQGSIGAILQAQIPGAVRKQSDISVRIPTDRKLRECRMLITPVHDLTTGVLETVNLTVNPTAAGTPESGKQTLPGAGGYASQMAMIHIQERETREDLSIWTVRKRMAPDGMIIQISGITALRMLDPVILPTTLTRMRTPVVKSESRTGGKRQKSTGNRRPIQEKDKVVPEQAWRMMEILPNMPISTETLLPHFRLFRLIIINMIL